VLQFLSVTRSALQVRQYAEVAVMTGAMHATMRRIDNPEVVTAEARVTQVWLRTPTGWRQASFHACRVATPGA